MSTPLPVTLDLHPGQALDCYLEHLAEANGITTAQWYAEAAVPAQPGSSCCTRPGPRFADSPA